MGGRGEGECEFEYDSKGGEVGSDASGMVSGDMSGSERVRSDLSSISF